MCYSCDTFTIICDLWNECFACCLFSVNHSRVFTCVLIWCTICCLSAGLYKHTFLFCLDSVIGLKSICISGKLYGNVGSRSVHHFGPDWNFSTTTGWIVIRGWILMTWWFRLTFTIFCEISQQQSDDESWNLVNTSMFPSGWIIITLVILWLFI